MHDNLPDRLVQAGVDLLRQEGVAALSLREIARRAGVSHGAPRRYFPTHQRLLGAIAREGYREMDRRISVVASAGGDPAEQLFQIGRAYVAFAESDRGMFELMFRHDLLRGNEIGLRQDSLALFDVLVRLTERAGAKPARQRAAALWANLQGIAQLHLWDSLELAAGSDDVDSLLRIAIHAHVGVTDSAKNLSELGA
ncbi:MAG: TetR/AcrR family transcriptional regulator [Hamadaea sp.]|uniref:TetR/AcrR family transcriptional regulator n=1 Tax=Hamadaea sp. TaxID=2024425 RepID=UPI0017EAF6A7|nr:TetR/AcrR family transcriptional regulator [Hamadaea sp.]NUR69671.1 TetR/AcrR family transcriptional regulator [Hamadaea sp.]NUT19538.1 TetR/AcrR family transcriptional regulator [Hamadaea sp.]